MSTDEARRRRNARERRQRKKIRRTIQLARRVALCIVAVVLILVAGSAIARAQDRRQQNRYLEGVFAKKVGDMPQIDVQLLTSNPYSRPQTKLKKVKGLVIHYVANPGTTAQQNRNYFEGLKDSKTTKASSHFIIGLDGEIIQCIPSGEIAYASNERNEDTLSIECCHPDATGKFNQETYDSLVHLTAWLCGKFDLTTRDVIRHYDVTGKQCPLYYVENPKAWQQFLTDVQDYIERNGEEENGKID
jgi:N-acetylmuramoyl-L-alanine amidase